MTYIYILSHPDCRVAGKALPDEHPMAGLLQFDFLLWPLVLLWGPPPRRPILLRPPLRQPRKLSQTFAVFQ